MVLFNNYDINYDEFYLDYLEWCKENDRNPDTKESQSFYNYVYSSLDIEWDDLMANIKYDNDCQEECVVLGTLGLWTGRHEINAKKFFGLKDAINACVTNIDYIIIKGENGVIYVNAIHHDGVNTFEIHKLNKKGKSIQTEEKLDNVHYHAKYHLSF